MSFSEHCRIESRLIRLRELREKYPERGSLQERTKIEEKCLSELCGGAFTKELLGTQYCLGMSKEFNCPKQIKINNGMRGCTRYYVNAISFFEMILKNQNDEIVRKRIYFH